MKLTNLLPLMTLVSANTNNTVPNDTLISTPNFIGTNRRLRTFSDRGCTEKVTPQNFRYSLCKKDGSQIYRVASPANNCVKEVNKFLEAKNTTYSPLYDKNIPGLEFDTPSSSFNISIKDLVELTQIQPLSAFVILIWGGIDITLYNADHSVAVSSQISENSTHYMLKISGSSMNLGSHWPEKCGHDVPNADHDPVAPGFYEYMTPAKVCKKNEGKTLEISVAKNKLPASEDDTSSEVSAFIHDRIGFNEHPAPTHDLMADTIYDENAYFNIKCNFEKCPVGLIIFNATMPASAIAELPRRCFNSNNTQHLNDSPNPTQKPTATPSSELFNESITTTPSKSPTYAPTTSSSNTNDHDSNSENWYIYLGTGLTLGSIAVLYFIYRRLYDNSLAPENEEKSRLHSNKNFDDPSTNNPMHDNSLSIENEERSPLHSNKNSDDPSTNNPIIEMTILNQRKNH